MVGITCGTKYTILSLNIYEGRSGGDCVDASPCKLGITYEIGLRCAVNTEQVEVLPMLRWKVGAKFGSHSVVVNGSTCLCCEELSAI